MTMPDLSPSLAARLTEALAKATMGTWKVVQTEPCAAMPEESHQDFYREVAHVDEEVHHPHGGVTIRADLSKPPTCINIACANFSEADATLICLAVNSLPTILARWASAQQAAGEATEKALGWRLIATDSEAELRECVRETDGDPETWQGAAEQVHSIMCERDAMLAALTTARAAQATMREALTDMTEYSTYSIDPQVAFEDALGRARSALAGPEREKEEGK
jgi:hypothetical protein